MVCTGGYLVQILIVSSNFFQALISLWAIILPLSSQVSLSSMAKFGSIAEPIAAGDPEICKAELSNVHNFQLTIASLDCEFAKIECNKTNG
jgi:hypothetical protein